MGGKDYRPPKIAIASSYSRSHSPQDNTNKRQTTAQRLYLIIPKPMAAARTYVSV